MPAEQRVFPDPTDLERIPALIEELGGVDIAFGGIGITGHLAFNEPDESLTPDEFAALRTRTLDIHPETRATNCVNDLGGPLEDMPKRCATIGMHEILGRARCAWASSAICIAPWCAGPHTERSPPGSPRRCCRTIPMRSSM